MKSLRMAVLLALLATAWNTHGAWATASGLPAHDAYIDVNLPNKNLDDNYLEVDASGSDCEPTMTIYMQWDLSSIADTATIAAATLTLTTTAANNTSGVLITLYETGDSWSEATLTASTAPVVGAAIETQSAPMAVGQTVVFNSSVLRSYLAAQASGDNKASLALRFSSGCKAGLTVAVFADRENLSVGGPNLQLRDPNAVKKSALRISGLDIQWPIVGTLLLGGLANLVWRRRAVQRRRL